MPRPSVYCERPYEILTRFFSDDDFRHKNAFVSCSLYIYVHKHYSQNKLHRKDAENQDLVLKNMYTYNWELMYVSKFTHAL